MKRFTIITRLAFPLIVAAAYAITIGTHSAPIAGWNGFREYDVPYVAPHMTAADHATFPTCSTTPHLTDTTLVERQDAKVVRIATADAYARAQAGNVWIIGYCD